MKSWFTVTRSLRGLFTVGALGTAATTMRSVNGGLDPPAFCAISLKLIVPGDRGVPNDARSRAVYESARRALLSPQCNPLRVPTDKHRTVMESTFRFNPRGLVPR